MDKYTTPVACGDWYGLYEAAERAGWSLGLCYPPGGPEHYRAYRGDGPTRVFRTRAEVCRWLDAGCPEAPLWAERRAA